MAADLEFATMGSRAHVIVVGGPHFLLDDVRRRIEDLDRRWSRFRPDSELSQLNDHAGVPFEVSSETRLLVACGIEGWWLSGGAFDPTVLGAVIRSGYDRNYEELDETSSGGTSILETGCEGIELSGSTVLLPPNTGFDSGGIGKGLAADVVATEAMATGAEGICINLGGDVRVLGESPQGGAWIVAVQHPSGQDPVVLVELAGGAIATSTTLKRRWTSRGLERHHLIDPRSGRPTESDISFCSVVAGEAWRAEVLAKAVLVNGAAHPFDILGGSGAEAVAVNSAGEVLASAGISSLVSGNVPGHLSALSGAG